MLHQVKIKRQLFLGQALEQGEYVLAFGRGGEVVGVLNPAFDAAQLGQSPQVQGLDQLVGLLGSDFGEYRHGGENRQSAKSGSGWGEKVTIVEGEKTQMTRKGPTALGRCGKAKRL